MSSSGSVAADAYDGVPAADLARRLGVPAVHAYAAVASTMDLAHAAAADGAPAGTVFVTDTQTAGRGRAGRHWASAPGGGVWASVVERPRDADALAVLSLRVGLALADALEAVPQAAVAPAAIRLKWPNDLLLGGRKLAGILAEARWREGAPEWVAVGVGVNRRPPADLASAVGLGDAVARRDVLAAVVAAVRGAATHSGHLSAAELAAFARRDAVRGRRALRPIAGRAAGVSPAGGLLVETDAGELQTIPTASVEYADDSA